MLQSKHARIFDRPVDPVALGIPDYPKYLFRNDDLYILSHSMDDFRDLRFSLVPVFSFSALVPALLRNLLK